TGESGTTSLAMGGDERSKILKARAKSLAAKPADADTENGDYLVFGLGSDSYGIELTFASEVLNPRELTLIPCAPSFVLGVLNLRGRVVSVLDLERLFGLPPTKPSPGDKVIVIRGGAMEFGLRAETIFGTRAIPANRILPSLPTLAGRRSDYLKGVTENQIAILDCAKMLGDGKLIVHENAFQ
ncbi:MAG: chemotaxis protein CheW, partial [Spirochaetaceae bacterium]|nr:chemotaxis protein CheW [Spirochaetaceae bacterium]